MRGEHHAGEAGAGNVGRDVGRRNRKKAAGAAGVQAAGIKPLRATRARSRRAPAFYFSDTRNCDASASCNVEGKREA
jgi:hypothetical protein